MSPDELDILAKADKPIPDNLLKYECDYFLSVRKLYGYYKLKLISLDVAKRDKQKILGEYLKAKQLFENGSLSQRLETMLGNIVTYHNADYMLSGITKLQHSYQAILQDIKQTNSQVIVKLTDINLEV